jgi:hypothetical protein
VITKKAPLLFIGSLLAANMAFAQNNEQEPLSFFITSVGLDGGDLGGLAGADAHCQALAATVGRGDVTWHAYLSTQGQNAVNARDRIGSGPWYGWGGNLIASDLAMLHGDTQEQAQLGSGLHAFHGRNEKGELVPGLLAREYGIAPSTHDILTGSQPDGTAYPPGDDQTCSNWTSNDAGSARVGHHDRYGRFDNSWNSTHNTRSCSPEGVAAGGGAGLFYCFAID